MKLLSMSRLTFAVGALLGSLTLCGPVFAQQQVCGDYDVPLQQYQSVFDLRTAQGFGLRRVSLHRGRVAALWTKYTPAAWNSSSSLSHASFSRRLSDLTSKGYHLTHLSTDGTFPNERYTDVWSQAPISGWVRDYRMTRSAFLTKNSDWESKGFRIVSLAVSGSGVSERLAAVWYPSSAQRRVRFGQSAAQLANYLNSTAGKTDKIVSLATDAGEKLTAVLQPGARGTALYFHDLTLVQLQETAFARVKEGFRPDHVVAYGAGSAKKFFATFVKSAAVQNQITGAGRLPYFDTAMLDHMVKHEITQGALAVTYKGRLVHAKGYSVGSAYLRETEPDSLFRIASISKPLTAVGVLRLVEQGRLRLDDKLTKFISGWRDTNATRITIRHLLQHRGGWDISRLGFDPMFRDSSVAAKDGLGLPVTPERIIAYMKSQTIHNTPGTTYAYSNFGYCLLGRIIEQVTKEPYEDYMAREVFLPIGANSMRIGHSPRGEQFPGEVEYDAAGRRWWSVMQRSRPNVESAYGSFNLHNMDAHGGVVSSAIDLARFATAFDDPNASPLLGRVFVDEMFRQPASGNYSLGWAVTYSGWPLATLEQAMHSGSLEGTKTRLIHWPQRDVNVVVLFNKRQGATGGRYPAIDLDSAYNRSLLNLQAMSSSYDLFKQYSSVSHRTLKRRSLGCGAVVQSTFEVPYIRSLNAARAKIGYPHRLEITSIPAGATGNPVLLAIGVPYVQLLDLRLLNAPGCWLGLRPVVTLAGANLGGRAEFNLPVPNTNSLIGVSADLQSMVVAPGANGLGGLFTAPARLRIGK